MTRDRQIAGAAARAVVLVVLAAASRPGPVWARSFVYPAGDSLPASLKLGLAAGDTLLVSPGAYRATETLPPGLVLRGDGAADSIVISPFIPSAVVLAFGSGGPKTRIENITFDAHMHPEVTSLYFRGGEFEVRGCRFIAGVAIVADSARGVIADNSFRGVESALRCTMSEIWVDRNEIIAARNGAISMRGSPLRITRNKITQTVNTGIVITGKRFVPVIGGDRGMGNEIHGAFNCDVCNYSGQVVNAQFNYWGIRSTEEMGRFGYPANITGICDRWDQEKAAGMVDYRNWLDAPGGSPVKVRGSGTTRRSAVVAGGGGLVIILIVALARRRRARAV